MSTAKLVGLFAVLNLLVGCSDSIPMGAKPAATASVESARPVDLSRQTAGAASDSPVAAAQSGDGATSESEPGAAQVPATGNAAGIPLRVLYLARSDKQRERAFLKLFEEQFQAAASISREEFVPAQARDFDVVVLDWSQDERADNRYPSPLGDLENWSTPTVFLGSAGLINAGPWQVFGGAG